ncbi:ankyrin repeat protein, putative [Trichomonas vaginalis G3]|uniref:Ankyrin repeat protein, putative n=1 Tax=Trichomonas vaginalis (strain ATCC PRA-98 / G3) TaxID=412133 RepID=A2EFZ2_TRIV3|nr:cyclin-dependent kinase inhibitor 2C-related family [Trichomonas vaginalis G3]EAY08448.1 ankyrin repeat protein, putative [Trichomonas vaginalis G3]KAI5518120.1 cyclin-dependent kinase inhibitor 2C-related family [Trichomonas vaginalis G3]|eukprot:XP_001320671.1 ankyrin repeat protein [Trichomonas vaginalis G3]
MLDQEIKPNEYSELRNMYKDTIDLYNTLYQLKTKNEEDLNSIYKKIKTILINSRTYSPKRIIRDILSIIEYNNRYMKSYLKLAKLIYDDYHVTKVKNAWDISKYLFYKEYGIRIDYPSVCEYAPFSNLDIHEENSIYRIIMDNDKESFISYTAQEGFNKYRRIENFLFPISIEGYTLLELCCYYGSVDCFKFLRSEFNSVITQQCLEVSFLGGNPEIISECLKYKTPNKECMKYAIISHNIDFVTFLINEYNIKIDLHFCIEYKNLESFLVYFDQTNNINKCFLYSTNFNIPSLSEYFLSLGANINEKNMDGDEGTALQIAVTNNCKKLINLLLSHGINVNEKNYYANTALHIAVIFKRKEIIEQLISHGVNINEKDRRGRTSLHIAVGKNNNKIVDLLVSHCVNINEKDNDGDTALHIAAYKTKEIVELLISHGANINEKDRHGRSALHIAASSFNKEIVELLISHGANVHEKDNDGRTALHIAASNINKEITELLISHGANINEKDQWGSTALHIATCYGSKEIIELLLSHGANINEQDIYGTTALHIAAENNCKETIILLLSHGANGWHSMWFLKSLCWIN